jgi:hypothetical protein
MKTRIVSSINVKTVNVLKKDQIWLRLEAEISDFDSVSNVKIPFDVVFMTFIQNERCTKVVEGLRKLADKLNEYEKESPCDHVIGYAEGVDEAWLEYASKGFSGFVEIKFPYCPLCGAKL